VEYQILKNASMLHALRFILETLIVADIMCSDIKRFAIAHFNSAKPLRFPMCKSLNTVMKHIQLAHNRRTRKPFKNTGKKWSPSA
jgi:hypothetical protein